MRMQICMQMCWTGVGNWSRFGAVMKDKAISIAKSKASYAAEGAIRRKPGVGKGQGSSGSKAKAYGALKPSGLKMHDAGYGVKYAEVPDFEVADGQAEGEAELAGQLVAEVADTSADVNALCEMYHLKREELGRLTGFSLRALAEWASGKLPSQPAKRRLQEVKRLLDALAEIVKPESIPKWLHQRNPAFDNLTPLQVIEFGEIDRLWAMVYDLGSSQAS